MPEPTAGSLATLAAEVRAELPRIQKTICEIEAVCPAAADAQPPEQRVRLYATAALLDTFYTAVERVLERVARQFEAVPAGPHGHAELLNDAGLNVARVRPPVLSARSIAALKRYLGFRHRFRNLYLFDLDAEQMRPLYVDATHAWSLAETDLAAFADELDRLAIAIGAGRSP